MSENNFQRVCIKISGDVQGVLYRSSSGEKSRELGLVGWVKNTLDGGVEIVAEGEGEDLNKLIRWCQQGPSFAKVRNVEVKWEKYTGEFESFEVKF